MTTARIGWGADDRDVIPEVCPVSMLPIQSRAEWVYTNPERTYRTTIALIGEAIFWVIPRGYVTEADMAAATALADDILAELHPRGTPFVFIENFAHTTGGTVGARRRYLRFTNNLDGLLGSFPYGMPPFFRFTFNFSRRLHLHRYRVHVVARYEDAVRAALDMLARHGISVGEPLVQQSPSLTDRSSPSAAFGGEGGQRAVFDAGHALAPRADALLAYLSRLDLKSPGIPDPPEPPPPGPLRPVFEALAVLKLDMDQFLAEHQALLADLQDRQRQMLEKSAAIETRNREMEVLLQQSGKDQAALGKAIRHNVATLLKPVLQVIRSETARPSPNAALDRLDADLDALIEGLFPRTDLHDYRLTAQEMRIVRLIRDGAHSGAIAHRLGVSRRTVEAVRGRLREKLGLRGRPRNLRTVLQALPED